MKRILNDINKLLRGMIFMLLLALLSHCNTIFAQAGKSFPTRQSAIEAFDKGNYEQAYSDFSQLLERYPRDPLYKYYCGASLVKMKKDPATALMLLDQSVNGASVVKALPPDAVFYLGRAQQMTGKFSEAVGSFNAYTDLVGKRKARGEGVPGYIQECENRKGMVVSEAVMPAAVMKSEKAVADAKPPVMEEVNAIPEKEKKETVGRKELPAEYEAILDEAMRMQYKADSLTQAAAEQKKLLSQVPESEKASVRMTISQYELLAASYQKSADEKYSEAQKKMDPKLSKDLPETDTMVKQLPPEPEAKVTGVKSDMNQDRDVMTEKQEAKTVTAAAKESGALSLFEILPGDAVYPDNKIKIDPELPDGLIYRIQLAVFRNPVAPSLFKGMTPVYGVKSPGSGLTTYYAGMFRRSADARKALVDVKNAGFKDAFIVAVADGKSVSADRAAMLEEEWGSRPLAGSSPQASAADTLPPTLSFRVEVERTRKTLKEDAVETLRTYAGNKGLDIVQLADGTTVYLIGKFITFESAAEYADLLVRNNYRNAKVAAWLGNKEIPVETAKQLFNNLK